MIQILKREDSGEDGLKKPIEFGCTEVVYNELNPKFIKTFIFPFKGEKNEELEFRVFNVQKSATGDLKQNKLIGIANVNLHHLYEN